MSWLTTKKTPRTCDFCGKDIVSEIQYRIQISQRGALGSFKKGQTRKFIKADNDADMCHPCFVIMQGHGYEAKFTTLTKVGKDWMTDDELKANAENPQVQEQLTSGVK